VKEVIELPLDEKEIADFQKSATIIRDVVHSLGL
jgi:hypothetical protein